ncbi:Papain-like cysteine peptidase superfamily [Sesbania bispinosa]|nr:Papain-like cysteine peptidase superfamily [Sesbania bispinosa]
MRQGGRRDIPEYDLTNKVRVRNSCEVEFLSQVNKEITLQQLDYIKRTPFRWTPEMPNELKICGPLLVLLPVGIKPFGSLSRARDVLREGRNSAQLHIVGCVAILQVVRHVEYTSDEVEEFDVLKEGLDEAACGFRNCPSMSNELEEVQRENAALREEKKELEYQICQLEQGLAELKEMVHQRGMEEPSCKGSKDNPLQGGSRNETHLVVTPLSIVKPSHEEMLRQLYVFCAYREPKDQGPYEYVFYKQDLTSMKPRGWVCNMVFLLAPKVFMADEMGAKGHVTYFMLNCRLVQAVSRSWNYFKVVFAPTLFESHWFCYVLDKFKKKMFVLDSMGFKVSTDRVQLNNVMECRFGDLLRALDPKSQSASFELRIEYVDLPRQRNWLKDVEVIRRDYVKKICSDEDIIKEFEEDSSIKTPEMSKLKEPMSALLDEELPAQVSPYANVGLAFT